jgi:hypothetical protein
MAKWIKADGKCSDLPTNIIATQLYSPDFDYIVEDVLLCRKGEVQ